MNEERGTIPTSVVEEDRRLDAQARTSQEDLARLRWHWTLDEANPERVKFAEYARAVGRNPSTVAAMVNGYAAFIADDTPGRGVTGLSQSLTERIRLETASETRRKAAQLIADNTGSRPANVLNNRSSEVAALVDTAQKAAIRRGTTVDAELERAADVRKKAANVRANTADARRARKDLRYVEIEGDVAAAMRHMNHVLTLARTVALEDEHIELITNSIANLRALLGLIDMQLTGTADVDWDTELGQLGVPDDHA